MAFYFNQNFTLLPEKYRPIHIDDIILPTTLKRKFNKIIKDNDIPNMLFYSSSPGVGKTTVAKALVIDCDVDHIYINASIERGIDIVRSKVSRYAEALTFSGKNKVVIFDEFDGATPELQDALRAFIEQYHDTCRFICTCNNLGKIIDPLQSRLELIDFNFSDIATKKEMLPKIGKHLISILKNENISYNDNNQIILDLIKQCYPDIRTMIKLIHDCNEQYGIITNEIFKIKKLNDEFFNFILEKKITLARKYIIDNNMDYKNLYTLIRKNILDKELISDMSIRAEWYIILAEYDYRNAFVSDAELNFTACLLELCKKG